MKSQLEALQEKVNEAAANRDKNPEPQNRAVTFCVTSGKGGVGKTAFSINFALALAAHGKKVLIIDADFGFSNVNIMLGKNADYTLEHVISKEKRLDQVMAESYPNVWYISGGSGVSELIDLDGEQLEQVLGQLTHLERMMDFIIFDTGAGINKNILKLMQASDRTVLVTTPEPTSVLDSYVVLKTASELPERPIIDVLINKANNDKEAQTTFESLQSVAGQNLDFKVKLMGSLPTEARITKSIKAMTPFVVEYPGSGVAIELRRIASQTVDPSAAPPRKRGIRGFFQRLVKGGGGSNR